jgi:hypothetical protein
MKLKGQKMIYNLEQREQWGNRVSKIQNGTRGKEDK